MSQSLPPNDTPLRRNGSRAGWAAIGAATIELIRTIAENWPLIVSTLG